MNIEKKRMLMYSHYTYLYWFNRINNVTREYSKLFKFKIHMKLITEQIIN